MVDIPARAVWSAPIWVATETEVLNDVGKGGKDGTAALSKL
jgi:hypothetical protein